MAGRKGAKRPSIFEVAKLAGVSHQTVSHRSSNSDCVHSASWTIATETNIVWARAVASIDDSAVTGP